MKRILALIMSTMLLLSLAACGSKIYQVTTKNGDSFVSKGVPNLDSKSETYKFNTPSGKEVILNKEDVKSIQEQ